MSATSPASATATGASLLPRIYVHSGVDPARAAQLLPVEVGASGFTKRGATAHFVVWYANSLGANGPTLADAVLGGCEADYNQLQQWFGNLNIASLPFNVFIQPGANGGRHAGCLATALSIDAFGATDGDLEKSIVVAEEDEVFMATQNAGWDCGASNGEALSRVLAAEIYPKELTPPGTGKTFATGPFWLQSNRPNWVDQTEPTDGDAVATGCGTLFINWLRFQLGFTLAQIVTAGGATLAQTYNALTGRSDGWANFIALVNSRFAAGQDGGLTNDNPFPIPAWHSQQLNGGGLTAGPAAAGDPAVVQFLDQFHVCYRDGNGLIHDAWYNPANGQWNLQQLNGGGPGLTAGPAAAGDPAVVQFLDQFHVCYRDGNGLIHDAYGDGHGHWLLQQLNGGGLTVGPAAAGDPAVVPFNTNQFHVCYRDGNGLIHDAYGDGHGHWLLQQLNGGGLTVGPAAAGDPAVLPFTDQFRVCYRDGNGLIHDAYGDGHGRWLLQQLNGGGLTGGPAAAGDPAVLQFGTQMHVCCRDGDGLIEDYWSLGPAY